MKKRERLYVSGQFERFLSNSIIAVVITIAVVIIKNI